VVTKGKRWLRKSQRIHNSPEEVLYTFSKQEKRGKKKKTGQKKKNWHKKGQEPNEKT